MFKTIIIETDKPCVPLAELFPELATSAHTSAVAASFVNNPDAVVSLHAAKSGDGGHRFRLQAASCDMLCLLCNELIGRLRAKSGGAGGGLRFRRVEPLPVDEWRACVDKHLTLRRASEANKEVLAKACVQFRAIQKRLLVKYKDKSPSSLENMDALLEATYLHIVAMSQVCMAGEQEVSAAASSLRALTSLMALLAGLAFDLKPDAIELLQSAMSSSLADTADLGWEEVVHAAMANLTRHGLTKSSAGKNQQQQQQQQSRDYANQLKMPADSHRLEKQMRSLIGKLESGASIRTDVYKLSNTPTTTTSAEGDAAQVPPREQVRHTTVYSSYTDADEDHHQQQRDGHDDNTADTADVEQSGREQQQLQQLQQLKQLQQLQQRQFHDPDAHTTTQQHRHFAGDTAAAGGARLAASASSSSDIVLTHQQLKDFDDTDEI